MCRTACDEVSAMPTVLTVTNLCQTLGLRSVHMKSSSVTFTSNDVLSDSHNLGRCHPSYALLSCFGLPYIIMADEIMIQTFWLSATHTPKVRSCSAWSSGQQFFGCRGCRLSVAVQLPGPPWPGGPGAHPSLVWPVFLLRSRLHEPTLCLRSRLHEPTPELISSCTPACIAW